jgi:carnitine O-acetyltransferase
MSGIWFLLLFHIPLLNLFRNLRVAKLSPDAYVQMVLQLAYYRLHGKWTATYETASTRQFLYGRTDCIRTCSMDAVNFVKTFCDPESNVSAEHKLLFSRIFHTILY